MDLHDMRSPESVNHIFSVWSVCVCVCPCVCDGCQHNSKTNNRRNTKLGILHLYHTQMLLETFIKIGFSDLQFTKIISVKKAYCSNQFYYFMTSSFNLISFPRYVNESLAT